MSKPRILVLLDYFLPGEKAGGPVRTLAGLIHHLGSRAQFLILTRDRDLGDATPYRGVPAGQWVPCGPGARCRYLQPKDKTPWALASLLRSTPYEVLYLNTLFSAPFSLVPLALRRCALVPKRPVILAPRGQLNPGALAFKRTKKRVFLALARHSGLFNDVVWQASSEDEEDAIKRWFGKTADVRIASNLRAPPAKTSVQRPERRESLQVVFISRIDPKKNLDGALEILAGVTAPVTFDIYGDRANLRYWRQCEALMRTLPSHIRATYRGILAAGEVHDTLHGYDLMLLPTFDENYGHAIAEALAAGCPPLISDRTPWRDLEPKGVGWDLPLDDTSAFREVVERVAAESPSVRAVRAAAAAQWMVEVDSDPRHIEANARLFGVG